MYVLTKYHHYFNLHKSVCEIIQMSEISHFNYTLYLGNWTVGTPYGRLVPNRFYKLELPMKR